MPNMTKSCRGCGVELNETNCPPSFLSHGFSICRKCNEEQSKERNKKNRLEVLSLLGNECQCCHIQDISLLSIDHIEGGGNRERKKTRGKSYINKLLSLPIDELTSKYRSLCFNCNYTIGFWGSCPHTLGVYDSEPLLIGNRGIKQTHLSEEEKLRRKNDMRQITRLKHRLEMIAAYGGHCTWCNEEHPLFLTLDHINNNGSIDQKGAGFYQELKQLGYPGNGTQLQLLCHNCNALKEYTHNRAHKSEIIKLEAEIYLPQTYVISEEIEEEMWQQARQLFTMLNKTN